MSMKMGQKAQNDWVWRMYWLMLVCEPLRLLADFAFVLCFCAECPG